jgi:hypothetical protein
LDDSGLFNRQEMLLKDGVGADMLGALNAEEFSDESLFGEDNID